MSVSGKLLRCTTPYQECYGLPTLEFERGCRWIGRRWKHDTAAIARPERYSEDVSGRSRQAIVASMVGAHVKSRALKPWSAVSLSPDSVADIDHPSRSALDISARLHELGAATVQAWREIVVAGCIRRIPAVP